MSQGLIPYNAMIQQMYATDEYGNAVPHDYVFVKADVNRKVAGEIASIRHVTVTGLKRKTARTKHKERLVQTIARDSRAPHHYKNSTVNLHDGVTERTTKVHLRLILKFNGKTVIY